MPGRRRRVLDRTSLARGGGFGTPAPPKREATIRVVVVVAPAAVSDPMIVLPEGELHGLQIPAGNWQPRRDVELPSAGNSCLVVFDELGDAWVPVWSPY